MSDFMDLYESSAYYIRRNPDWDPTVDENSKGTFIGLLPHIDYMMWQLIAMEDCTDFDTLARVCDETYPLISDFVRKYRDICQNLIDDYNDGPISLIVCADDRGKTPEEREKLRKSYRHHAEKLTTEDLMAIGHLVITQDEDGNDCVVPRVYGLHDIHWDKCLLADFESDIEAQMNAIRWGRCAIIYETETMEENL